MHQPGDPSSFGHSALPPAPADPFGAAPARPPTAPTAPPGAGDWRFLHLWQIQPLRDALVVLAVVGLVYLGYVLSVVTVPLLLAIGLAYLVEPLVKRVTRLRFVSRQGAVLSIILALGLLIAGPVVVGLGVGVLQGTSYVRELGRNVSMLLRSVDDPANRALYDRLPGERWRRARDDLIEWRRAAEELGVEVVPPPAPETPPPGPPPSPAPAGEPAPIVPPALPPPADAAAAASGAAVPGAPADPDAALISALQDPPPPERERPSALLAQAYRWAEQGLLWIQGNAGSVGKQAVQTGAGAVSAAIAILSSISYFFFGLFLTLFFFYFISVGYGRFLRFWERLIPERKKGRTIELLQKMDVVVAGFVRGRLTICAILIVTFMIGYWAIGVPTPVLLAVLVGALSLIPYAQGVGIPAAILLLLLDASGGDGMRSTYWWIIGAPLAVHGIVQLFDDYILTPMIQGKSTGMDTPTILFASMAGGVLAGFYGLLLAIPVAACIKILAKEVLLPHVKAWAQGRAEDPLPIAKR